ncbi:MAG: hypothetical protein M3M98_00650 [Nitrospirota bacterium]|nr:hypothetical protein [Nitrospirota bacterium]
MSAFSAAFLSRRAQDLRTGLRHAFAVRPEQKNMTIEDLALLERVAEAIVARRMATPATLFLESLGPMNFLGSQALHFLSPIIECALSGTELTQIARLLERRDSIPRLVALIETKVTPPQEAPVR